MRQAPFESKEDFIQQNLPLVHFAAKRFIGRSKALNVDYDDIYAVGCEGLVKAYNRYDPAKGLKFSTYAVPIMIWEIKRYFRDAVPVLKVPRIERETAMKIRWLKLDQEAPVAIAASLGCNIQLVEKALEYLNLQFCSMDFVIDEDDSTAFQDTIINHDDFTPAIISDFYNHLSKQERILIQFRVKGLTQSECGRRGAYSQAQASRLQRAIKVKASQYFERAVES